MRELLLKEAIHLDLEILTYRNVLKVLASFIFESMFFRICEILSQGSNITLSEVYLIVLGELKLQGP